MNLLRTGNNLVSFGLVVKALEDSQCVSCRMAAGIIKFVIDNNNADSAAFRKAEQLNTSYDAEIERAGLVFADLLRAQIGPHEYRNVCDALGIHLHD